MNSIEVSIAGQKFILRGTESPEYLAEVAELVRRRVEAIQKNNPKLSLQKTSLLAAFDFASDSIKLQSRHHHSKTGLLAQTRQALERVEEGIRQAGLN
jgi:cell division protein ZapA